jgi:CheY-like chemotaxis protein
VLDLNAVVTDAEKLLRRVIGEDVRLRTALAPGLGPVRADPGQLEQVLLNLCVNARDAMPTGGELTLSTEDVLLDAARARELGADGPGGYVVLAVADTGAGMTDEVRRRLFEPFFTTKEKGKGTGLGLAVVHGIVEQSGGLVKVESEAGRGTTFRVYLPRTGAAAAGETGRSGVRALPRGAETVLLAEDEAAVRTLTALILRSAGYTVLEAASGDDALRVATGHAGPVHLLVTDVVMPGTGGRELADRVTALRPGLRVLYLSGYTDDAVVRHGVLRAEVNFLQKPFAPAALGQAVREALDQPGRPDAHS